MAHIDPKLKRGDKYVYIIKGVVYRVKIVVWNEEELDFTSSDNLKILVWSFEQSYHKNTPYSMHGTLRYHGISLKEAWEEVQYLVGKCSMPKPLKKLQPFIANQV